LTLTIDLQTIPLKADPDGVMRVGGTRVTLDTVVHTFEQGHTAEEIVSHYPALRLADVYAVIAYYLNNQAEVQAYLRQQKAEARALWEQIETKTEYQAFRERLLARHQTGTNPAKP
jgi:uncharacterized protein (DUF433 family)